MLSPSVFRKPLTVAIRSVAATVALAIVTVSPLCAQNSQPGPQAEMEMMNASRPFRATADAFVAAAAKGDTVAVEQMISPNMRQRAGADAVRRVVAMQVLPFFADYKETARSVTVTQTSDQFGSAGFTFYMYSTPKNGEQRPFVLYVVNEGGKPVIANVLVDRLVEGRHK